MRDSILRTVIIALFLTVVFAFPAWGEGAEITVSAAMSLKNAFEEIGRAFEAEKKGVKVWFNFGASGDLVRQIEAGAPVDVFASAAGKDMDRLEEKGLVAPGSRRDFASNVMVLVTPAQARKDLVSFKDLARDEIGRVAIGNPRTAPAGRYTEEVLRNLGLLDAVMRKVVLGENVRQVLDYVARGEVDAGIVYRSDTLARPGQVRIVAEAPAGSHEAVRYPVALLRDSAAPDLAKAFIATVLSHEGRRIFLKNGFQGAAAR